MSLWSYLWSHKGKILSILITLFFIVGTSLALYDRYYGRNPKISIDIINEANVLDINKPMKALTITFKGDDIQEKKLNLRIFTIRIENNGEINILDSFYDEDWGFRVANGKFVEVRLIDTNYPDYITTEKLNPQMPTDEEITLEKILFDKGKYFTLEVLVLHEKEKSPEIIPIGKISGIDKLTITKSWQDKGKKTLRDEIFQGNIVVHILRFFYYIMILVVFAITAVLILILKDYLYYEIVINPRAKLVYELSKSENITGDSNDMVILNLYRDKGLDYLKSIRVLLKDRNLLDNAVKSYLHSKETFIDDNSYGGMSLLMTPTNTGKKVMDMDRDGLFRKDICFLEKDNEIHVDLDFMQKLDKIINFLEDKEK